jgi:type IV pilus assembly protein PilC
MEPLKSFTYFGRDSGNMPAWGELRAHGTAAAAAELSRRGIAVEFLREVHRRKKWKGSAKVPPERLLLFTRQFALLLRAGIPQASALALLAAGEESPVLRRALEGIGDGLRMGSYLHETLAGHGNVFDPIYRRTVRAGELAGDLPAALEALAGARAKAIRARSRTISALIHPLTVLAVALCAILFLCSHVLPRFLTCYQAAGTGEKLPALTRAMLSFSIFFNHHWFGLIFSLAAAIAAIAAYGKTRRGRLQFSRFSLRIPVIGPLLLRQHLIPFLRTFSHCLRQGIPFAEAFPMACEVVPNAFLRAHLAALGARSGEGVPLAEILPRSLLPGTVTGLIAVGESSGSLSPMAAFAADLLDEELALSLERLTAVMRPLVVLLLAAVVGMVALSLFLPLTQLVQLDAF